MNTDMKQTNTSLIIVLSLFFALVCPPVAGRAEDSPKKDAKIYDEEADGFQQVAGALVVAQKEHKRVLLDFGYNACPWCIKLHTVFETDKAVSKLLKSDYVVVYIDWMRGGA